MAVLLRRQEFFLQRSRSVWVGRALIKFTNLVGGTGKWSVVLLGVIGDRCW